MKFSSGIAGKLLFVSIGEQKLRDSGAKRRGVLEPVSKRESRFENTLEEASFLLLFLLTSLILNFLVFVNLRFGGAKKGKEQR
ncbi:hypothetical protein C5O00_11365 [Pukyongia salina]|uniref:Uncharacterized protein n=1 Tax=Pukyongia salina TaxID=2094025 RepID=A0A2S0HYP9_9FLAO|nr:hypothetical protein C5O00_11365 [Pukyongia salina]